MRSEWAVCGAGVVPRPALISRGEASMWVQPTAAELPLPAAWLGGGLRQGDRATISLSEAHGLEAAF